MDKKDINMKTYTSNCQSCDMVLPSKRTPKGNLYYVKLCKKCLHIGRVGRANKLHTKAIYDKIAKYDKRKCKMCDKEFNVRGRKNNKRLTCSSRCASANQSKQNKERKAYRSTINSDKKWWKMFGIDKQGKMGRGQGNVNAKNTILLSPFGIKYKITNLLDFVRTHEELFDKEDVAWVPTKSKSKVKEVNYRVSLAIGCLRCRASNGLYSIATRHKGRWKGWVCLEKLQKAI